jgi:hypothetical protein
MFLSENSGNLGELGQSNKKSSSGSKAKPQASSSLEQTLLYARRKLLGGEAIETDESDSIYESLNPGKLILLYRPTLVKALKEMGCPHPSDAGVFLSQLYFWLRTEYGYYTKDGMKWIHNSYEEWISKQITGLSRRQFGVVCRWLNNYGFISKSNYAALRRYLIEKPLDFHPWQTKSWISLNVEYIREITGFDFDSSNELFRRESLEPIERAEVPKRSSRNSKLVHANSSTELPTIYIENSISTRNGENQNRESNETFKEYQEWLKEDPWTSNDELESNRKEITDRDVTTTISQSKTSKESQSHLVKGLAITKELKNINTSSNSFQSDSKEKSPAPKTTIITNTTKASSQNTTKIASNTGIVGSTNAVSNVVHHKQIAKPKLEHEERPLYIWEDAINYPNENFLNWRYENHYKPQGGKWASGGRSYARKEFYNDTNGADLIYREYLLFTNQIANNSHQQQNQGIKAVLPSFIVKLPEASQENKEQVAINIATVAARGAGIALPDNFAPGSNQHMSFKEAQSLQEIKPLPELGKPTLAGDNTSPGCDSLSESEKFERDFALNCAKWKLPSSREKAIKWASQHSDKVQVTEDGLSKLSPTLESSHEQQVSEGG